MSTHPLKWHSFIFYPLKKPKSRQCSQQVKKNMQKILRKKYKLFGPKKDLSNAINSETFDANFLRINR